MNHPNYSEDKDLSMLTENIDKAGVEHWNNTERNKDVRIEAFSPLPGLRGFGRRMWHKQFSNAFSSITSDGRLLLELGCGGSAFLPYFANSFGFEVSGIDYSPHGVELAQQMCIAHGVNSNIKCIDFFSAPSDYESKFDAVVSFGVVEHFTDTNKTVASFSNFVRPGGIILTIVPNMSGLPGLGQRILEKSVYDKHEVINPERLRRAHELSELQVLKCDYFMFMNFGVINPGVVGAGIPNLLKKFGFNALRVVTLISWLIESGLGNLPSNSITSPYVLCLARKQATVLKH